MSNAIIHPLSRNGTHQRERLIRSLIPANFQLDERGTADFMSFVAKLSEQVNYYDLNNQIQGDWLPFWSQDATMILAIIASIDLDQMRFNYRSLEIALIQQFKKECSDECNDENEEKSTPELLGELIESIFSVAAQIATIYNQIPNNHPLKAEVGKIISTLARKDNFPNTPLVQLIGWRKGIGANESEYNVFISEVWNLTQDDLYCIDYVEVSADDREAFWQLFLAFYKAIAMIVARAEKAMQRSLFTRDDHPPHITLLIAFLELFKHLQNDLNNLRDRHLNYYYEDILRLQKRKEIPDKVHLVFEVAQNLNNYLIEQKTLFVDGKDSDGNDRIYSLEDELVIHQTKLVERKNLYLYKEKNKLIPLVLPAANKKDGNKVVFPKGTKAWGLGSAKFLFEKYKTIQSVLNRKKPPVLSEKIHAIESSMGLIIASPELAAPKGAEGTITLSSDNIDNVWNNFTFEISTSKGIRFINPVKGSTNNKISKNITFSIDNLGEDIAPYNLNGYDFKDAFIVIKPKDNIDTKDLSIQIVSLSVDYNNMRGFDVKASGIPVPENGEITFLSAVAAYNGTVEFSAKYLIGKSGTIIPSSGIASLNFINGSFKGTINIAQGSSPTLTKIPTDLITINYKTNDISNFHTYHLHPYGGVIPNEKVASHFPLLNLPQYKLLLNPVKPIEPTDRPDKSLATSNMALGFEGLVPGQTLSLLFKMAQGTGNPDHVAPEVVWSYLSNNVWVRLPQQYILKDETNGLGKTGIVKLLIPTDITNNNTLITGGESTKPRLDLFWLQISCAEFEENGVYYDADALPLWEDVFVNAETAIFNNEDNTLEHIEVGIEPDSITQPRFRDVNIRSVKQPFKSFGGRDSESNQFLVYYTRISERLRHRNRAATVYDYERLLLEKFPKIAVAKCIPHTSIGDDVRSPGQVLVSVLPYPDKMIDTERQYYPSFDAGDLKEMRDFLAAKNTYWVGGQGISKICCDGHECDCDCDTDNLGVLNAHFEPVRISVCVRFFKGKDIAFYTKKLNEDLKRFLAPWALDKNTPIAFGTPIYRTELLRFLENLDYVDIITDIKIIHFENKKLAHSPENSKNFSDTPVIQPFTPRSVLTSYLDILNEENPNVIDHDINVISNYSDCECKDCNEKK